MARATFSGRRLMTGVATMPLVVAGLGVLTMEPAHAQFCSPAWSDVDPGSGYPVKDGANLRQGPGSNCGLELTLGPSVHLAYDCFRWNTDTGETWTHVHLYGSPNYDRGWVNDNKLKDFGATKACPD